MIRLLLLTLLFGSDPKNILRSRRIRTPDRRLTYPPSLSKFVTLGNSEKADIKKASPQDKVYPL
jgi:hypothetical protein